MFSRWIKSNDLNKYCAAAACAKTETQKTTKRFNTSGNTTQISSRMRYSQIVR
jgi:hypothetical protein